MRKYTVKKILMLVLLSLFVIMPALAQTVVKRVPEDQQDFKLLKYATEAFESGDYGEALSYAEKAKNSRRQECSWKLYVLDNLQKLSYVRRTGDSLSALLPVLQEHNQNDACLIIQEELKKRGNDFFSDSLSSMMDFITDSVTYPEANYIIGKIYRLEGEVEFAQKFFLDAYAAKDLLDVSDVQYDILYDLADLCRYNMNMDDYEKYLLLIVKDNRFYTNQSFMNAMVGLIESDDEAAVEKFFLLYRCDDYYSIKALHLLSEYYLETNDNAKALNCSALGCIAAVTKIDEALKQRLNRYTYSNLEDLFVKSTKYIDIIDWGNSFGVWEMFHEFALSTNRSGKLIFSRKLLSLLAAYVPEPYWKVRAAELLIK